MPWSPAPVLSSKSSLTSSASFTPREMSGDCSSSATKTAQLFESKPPAL